MRATRIRGYERLEQRMCLTVVVDINDGSLLVQGEADGPVALTSVADGAYQVSDNGALVSAVDGDGNPLNTFEGIRRIDVDLDQDGVADNDQVTIDLNGFAVDRIMVDLGDGENSLRIEDGIVSRSLRVRGGANGDAVELEGDLTAERNVFLYLGDGDDTVDVDGDVSRNLVVYTGDGDDLVDIGPDATIGRNARVVLGDGDNTFNHAGEVGRRLQVRGGIDDDTVTLLAEAAVERSVSVSLGDGNNTASVSGNLGSRFSYRGGAGDDNVDITSDGVIGGTTRIRLGEGSNQVTHFGIINGDLRVTSGNEDDQVTIDDDATVEGDVELSLGEDPIDRAERFFNRIRNLFGRLRMRFFR